MKIIAFKYPVCLDYQQINNFLSTEVSIDNIIKKLFEEQNSDVVEFLLENILKFSRQFSSHKYDDITILSYFEQQLKSRNIDL